MPEQNRRFYDIPGYVKENLAVMIAECEGITRARMANAYYENLRDRIGIVGFTYIPTADSPDKQNYLNKLNRFNDQPITSIRILTFEGFRRWSTEPRFRTITVESLLDEVEELASNTSEQDMELEEIQENPRERDIVNYTRNPPLLIVDSRSDEIINTVDIDDTNVDYIIILS